MKLPIITLKEHFTVLLECNKNSIYGISIKYGKREE